MPASRRAIVLVHVSRIGDSCGYGVPLMSFEGRRPHMNAWAEKKVRVGGPEALQDYQREKNSLSLDGLPAVDLQRSPRSRAAPGGLSSRTLRGQGRTARGREPV